MRSLLLVLGLLLAACAEADRADSRATQSRCETGDGKGGCALWGPSLVELIARPEKFHGKAVRVIGFVNFEFEGNGLYLSRTDWEHGIARNGVWIDPPPGFESDSAPSSKSPNQRYVIVEGVFNASASGHMGMWSGAIERVTRLEAWPSRAEIQHPQPR